MSATNRDPNPKVEIAVNGKRVPAKPFVQEFIGETVIAMVRTLKRTDDQIGTVEIKVTRKP